MGKKFNRIKETAVDFVDENAIGVFVGLCTVAEVAIVIGTFVMAKKATKWYGREVGKEIAKALKP